MVILHGLYQQLENYCHAFFRQATVKVVCVALEKMREGDVCRIGCGRGSGNEGGNLEVGGDRTGWKDWGVVGE